MKTKTLGLLVATAITLTACALPGGPGGQSSRDPDEPILQVRFEGGFAPIEFILAQGPRYTLLGDGRLISEGPVIAIFPGPLLPNYLVTHVGDDDMDRILALVEEIGLPNMTSEVDNSARDFVADASTEVVTYWDDEGTHQYAVYALGIEPIEPGTTKPMNSAFSELLQTLDQATAKADAVPYEPERVRVLAGVAMAPVDPEFEDIRPWPLGDDDPADWDEVQLQWRCNTYGPKIMDTFKGATQVTEWLHPNPMMDAPAFSLLVRPLHPGEEDCEIPSPPLPD
jgi:hypothetical protein